MKSWLILLMVLSGTFSSVAQLSLESFGESFDGRNIEILWNVPTNELPVSLDTFKVRPTVFADEAISNVIELCDFRDPETVRHVFSVISGGKAASYKEPYPEKPVLGKFLSIMPENGCIEYSNPTAEGFPRTPIEGVPSEAQALDLAIGLLPKLAIKESELTHKPDGRQFQYFGIRQTVGRFDKQKKERVEEVAVRGVILFRQVNGVSFSGPSDCGGLRVEFGNNAQIKELALTWRNLKPDKTATIASPAQMIQQLKTGKAVIRLPEDFNNASVIKKLTITQAQIFYFGMNGTELQKTVYPYAMLTATADTGATNFVVSLNCPVVK